MPTDNTKRVALVTAHGKPDEDLDLPLQLGALRARGLEADAISWDIGTPYWANFDAVVIRSTWNYSCLLDKYLAWIDSVAATTMLYNPAPVVHWNSDKRYLQDLQKNGVETVETNYIAPEETAQLPNNGDFVVKPAVSAGARDAARYSQSFLSAAVAHIEMLHRNGATAMIQPYLRKISEGERALIFLDGSFSHAMWKAPVLDDIGVIDNSRVAHPGLRPYQPTNAELELAEHALTVPPCADSLLFARVDLALADDGRPVVMELELIEPNLFMIHNPRALAAFAEAVERRVLPDASRSDMTRR